MGGALRRIWSNAEAGWSSPDRLEEARVEVVYVLEALSRSCPSLPVTQFPEARGDAPRSADPSRKKLDLHDALSQAAKTLRYQQ